MYVDMDVLFDELVGYELYHKAEVTAVIHDKVKCEDGSVLEFMEDVSYAIDEFDELIVLRKKQSVEELSEFKEFLKEKGETNLIESIERQIDEAKQNGVYITYACVCNDTFYDLFSFTL